MRVLANGQSTHFSTGWQASMLLAIIYLWQLTNSIQPIGPELGNCRNWTNLLQLSAGLPFNQLDQERSDHASDFTTGHRIAASNRRGKCHERQAPRLGLDVVSILTLANVLASLQSEKPSSAKTAFLLTWSHSG